MIFRVSPRIRVSYPAVFSGDRMVGEGSVTSLSLIGCAIRTIVLVQKGRDLELRVLMPDREAPLVVSLARVRWGVVGKCGVEFLSIPTEDQARLSRLINTRLFKFAWVSST